MKIISLLGPRKKRLSVVLRYKVYEIGRNQEGNKNFKFKAGGKGETKFLEKQRGTKWPINMYHSSTVYQNHNSSCDF